MSLEDLKKKLDSLTPEMQKELEIFLLNLERKYGTSAETIISNRKRTRGMMKGKIKIADDFDAPIPEFENGI